jgi:hypothetical protein
MSSATTYIHLHDGDNVTGSTAQGHVAIQLDSAGHLFAPADVARKLAAQLLIAADELDSPVDRDAVARTLAIATGGAA